MPELLLHYIWQRKAFLVFPQYTADGKAVEVVDVGLHNSDSGPDFFNAKIRIDGVMWVGNIEIHLLSSDWYRHGHDKDKAYDSIVLHVVKKIDREVFNSKGEQVVQCELRYPTDEKQLERLLIDRLSLCSDRLFEDTSLLTDDWRHSLLTDRLKKKMSAIEQLLALNRNNWEEAFYITLAHNFGFHTNGLPFELLAQSLPLPFILKHRDNLFQLEAMLFGQAGLLNETVVTDDYTKSLWAEYSFLKKKFSLTPIDGSIWKMLRMRPQNFPHIRIAQFAALLHQSEFLFSKVTEQTNLKTLREMFNITPSEYWSEHYRFGAIVPKMNATLGTNAIDLLIINTIVPYKFAFARSKGYLAGQDAAFSLLLNIPAEKNNIINRWRLLGFKIKNAADSQTFIHLYQNYCLKNRCMSCDVGWQIFTIR